LVRHFSAKLSATGNRVAEAIEQLMTMLEGEHKTAYPDVASGVIIQALWIKLTQGNQWTQTNF